MTRFLETFTSVEGQGLNVHVDHSLGYCAFPGDLPPSASFAWDLFGELLGFPETLPCIQAVYMLLSFLFVFLLLTYLFIIEGGSQPRT